MGLLLCPPAVAPGMPPTMPSKTPPKSCHPLLGLICCCQALKEVPKSGEVWCEGARIHLNPLSKAFDLETAGKYLGFAVQFTPQYGDSFMECLR